MKRQRNALQTPSCSIILPLSCEWGRPFSIRPPPFISNINNLSCASIAGHETTSIVLNMTLYSLACDKARQDRLRKELMAFGGDPSFNEMWNATSLPYLDAVTREGFRLYPPSTRNEKVAEKYVALYICVCIKLKWLSFFSDDILPLAVPIKGANGKMITHIPIKAGQVIHIPSIALNRLDSAWGDGDAFRPERWLEGKPGMGLPDSTHLPGGWSSLFTFLVGPRSCIAYRLGQSLPLGFRKSKG